jgi:transcriptional regulator with XRE-family HTH domain
MNNLYVYPNIKNFREKRGLSQQQIAELLGTRQTQYSRWERGAYEIPCHVVVRLAQFYQTTTDALLEGGYPTNNA